MTAPHFFLPDVGGERLELSGDEARHAARSLRVRPGEHITITDGRGRVAEARVAEVGARVVAEVLGTRTVPAPRPRLVVWQAIASGDKLDLAVRTLAELGASEIVPFAAERSVARWDERRAPRKLEHLRRVARESCKVARRAWLVAVTGPRPLEEVEPPALALHEEATVGLRDALPPVAPASLALVVGPEGGLAPRELATLERRGAITVGLGAAILRTETAGIAAAALVLGRYGALG